MIPLNFRVRHSRGISETEAFLPTFSLMVQAFVKSLSTMPETFKDMENVFVCLEFGSRADFDATSPVSFLSYPNAMEINVLEAKGIEGWWQTSYKKFRKLYKK